MTRALKTAAVLCVLLFAGAPVWADATCPVPEDLAFRDLSLPQAKAAVVAKHRLVILALGGASTAGIAAGDPAASYPAQLQAALTAALTGIQVTVVNEGVPRTSTAVALARIPAAIEKTAAKLVIWAPGARDAALHSGQEEFFDTLRAGIDAVRKGGADLILIDMQYVPSMEQFSQLEDYRDLLRGAASANDVPLLPRHDLMRAWSTDGTLDLDATGSAERTATARMLYLCLAKTLAVSIQEAVH